MVLLAASMIERIAASTISFGPPHQVLNRSWADGFYGLGSAAASRLVLGDGLVSTNSGSTWTAAPAECPLGAVRAAFLSDCPEANSRSVCTAMTSYGHCLRRYTKC